MADASPTFGDRLARRQELVARIQQMLVDQLYLEVEPSDLDPDAPLFGSGHGLDSIDAVELVVALDGEFGVQLEEARILSVPHLRTVNTLADLVLSQSETA